MFPSLFPFSLTRLPQRTALLSSHFPNFGFPSWASFCRTCCLYLQDRDKAHTGEWSRRATMLSLHTLSLDVGSLVIFPQTHALNYSLRWNEKYYFLKYHLFSFFLCFLEFFYHSPLPASSFPHFYRNYMGPLLIGSSDSLIAAIYLFWYFAKKMSF